MTTARFTTLLKPALVLSVPPLVGLTILAAYVALESVCPGALTAPRPRTMPEAIMVGNGPRVLEMMAEGLDVNSPAPVRPELLYQLQPPGVMGQSAFAVTPLEAALLSQRIEVVGLLMRTGANVSRSMLAPCLARERLPEALPLLGLEAAHPSAPATGGLSACFAPPDM